MLCCVYIRGLSGHEIKEAIELHVAGVVGVDDGQDSLEVDFTLLVLAHGVAETDQAGLELVGGQASGPRLVEVVERGTELVQLLLSDALERKYDSFESYVVINGAYQWKESKTLLL